MSKNTKILLVSDSDYQPLLFKYKNNNPDLDIKFMTTRDLVDILSFSYIKDPIPYLIEVEHIEYNKAKKIVNLLKAPFASKNEYLSFILDKLKGEYIAVDENNNILKNKLGLLEINQCEINLFEDDEDELLKNLLDENDLDYNLIHFSDLDIKTTDFYSKPEVVNFQTKFDQFFYLFSKLREELKTVSEEERNKYLVLVKDDNDLFYTNFFSSLFKMETFIKVKSPIFFTKVIKDKVKQISSTKSFDIEEDGDELKELKHIIQQYNLDKVSKNDFDFAYLNLLEIVNSKSFIDTQTTKGLWIVSDFSFDPSMHIYATNFQFDCFYKEAKDDNVISDLDIKKIGANPSYVLTLLDKRKKHNYIKYLDIKLLSRVEQHLTDHIYDSQFIELFKQIRGPEEAKDVIQHIQLDENSLFTKMAKNIYIGDKLDKEFYTDVFNDVNNSYDHSFKGLKGVEKLTRKAVTSITSVKSYLRCPFGFLMNKVLPQMDTDKHNAWKGTMLHALVEKIYYPNFNYESEYEFAKLRYKEQVELDGFTYSDKEEMCLSLLHYWFYPIAVAMRNEAKKIKIDNNEFFQGTSEVSVKYTVAGYRFNGTIDKIIFTDAEIQKDPTEVIESITGEKKYYTIIDYKSGSHGSDNFDPLVACTGYDIQLPLYFKAIKDGALKGKTDGYKFGGMGIKHIYGSTLKDAIYKDNPSSEEDLFKKLKSEGLFREDNDYFSSFDRENINDKGVIGKANVISEKLMFNVINEGQDDEDYEMILKYKKHEYRYTFSEMIKDIEEKVEEIFDKLQQGKFDIAPLSTDIIGFDKTKLVCKYCAYRDICFRKLKDANDLSKVVDQKFSVSRRLKDEDEKKGE